MNILNNLCLGPYFFEVAIILRQAMLVTVMLLNSETWLRLTKGDTKKLEQVDEMLLRKLLQTPISTPIPALYLETGVIPIRFIIKTRRIMFLHHIITRPKESLIYRVLQAQINKPVKGDWCLVVVEDLEALGLGDLTVEKLEKMPKESLKKLLKVKVQQAAFQELIASKESLSKLTDLEYDQLIMQPYLSINSVSITHKRLEFRWRTKMMKVNCNYGLKISCPLCHEEEDTQEHT